MSQQLELYIPQQWPSDQADEAAADTSFSWLLRGRQGEILRCGEGTLAALPAADSCRLVVPASRVLLSQVRPPAQNRKKFMQALPYAVEDRIMADPESVHVAAGPILGNGDMPVAIVERGWLQKTLDLLKQAGIKPVTVETEALLIPWQAGIWTLTWHGNGGTLRQGQYSGLTLDGGDAFQPPPGLRLALEEATSPPSSIQIHCKDAAAPDITTWSSSLGVPVTLANEQKQHASEQQGINLLQGKFAPGGTRPDWLPQLRPAIILIAVLTGIQFTFSLLDWAMLKHEKRQLTISMEQSFRSAFPDAKVIVDAPLQMNRNLAELRHAAGQPDQNDFLPLMASIAPLLGQHSKLRHLEYQQGTLNLRLTLPDSNAVDTLRTRLATIPLARLESGNTGPDGVEIQLNMGTQK